MTAFPQRPTRRESPSVPIHAAAQIDVAGFSFRTTLFICCLVCFIAYLGSYMRIPIIPLYARSIGADTVQVGMINSSFMLIAGLFSLPLGMVSDRVGRKLLIMIGLLISGLSSFLFYLCATPPQMALTYLLFGIGLACFAPTLMSYVADASPPNRLASSYGWYTTALYGGMSIGPAAGGLIGGRFGLQPVFIVSGVFFLLVLILVFLILPHARRFLPDRPIKRNTLSTAKELLRNFPLLACWLVTLGGCFGLGMFVTFLPLRARDQGLSVTEIGLVFAVQAVVNALSRIPFGYLCDRVADRRMPVIIGLVGYSGAMACLGYCAGVVSFVLGAAAMGISMGVAFTALGALIVEVVPPDSKGLAMGGYNSCIYFGMMLSAVTMGAVITRFGFEIAFAITGLLNLGAALFFYLTLKQSAGLETGSPLRRG